MTYETEGAMVAMEKALCPVCGTVHETGSILLQTKFRLDARGKPVGRLKKDMITGYDLCVACKMRNEDGYVGLVEATARPGTTTLKPSEAAPTGQISWVRRSAWEGIFDTPVPRDKDGELLPFVYVEVGVIAMLAEISKASTPAEAGEAGK